MSIFSVKKGKTMWKPRNKSFYWKGRKVRAVCWPISLLPMHRVTLWLKIIYRFNGFILIPYQSGGGHGNPLQDSCLENSMDREAQWATCPQGCKESDMSEGTQHTQACTLPVVHTTILKPQKALSGIRSDITGKEWYSSQKVNGPLSTCLLSRSVLSDFLQPHELQPTRLLSPWDFPGKNTGVSCHFLLQGIFPTQGSNPRLLHLQHCQEDSLSLCHLGSPKRTARKKLPQQLGFLKKHLFIKKVK